MSVNKSSNISFTFLGEEFEGHCVLLSSAVAQAVNDACMITASALTRYDCPDKYVIDTMMRRLEKGDTEEWEYVMDAATWRGVGFYAYTNYGNCINSLEEWEERGKSAEIRELVWYTRNSTAQLSVWYWPDHGEYVWKYSDWTRGISERCDDYEQLISRLLFRAFRDTLDRQKPADIVL